MKQAFTRLLPVAAGLLLCVPATQAQNSPSQAASRGLKLSPTRSSSELVLPAGAPALRHALPVVGNRPAKPQASHHSLARASAKSASLADATPTQTRANITEPVRQAWATGPDNFTLVDMVVDDAGNTYVTGTGGNNSDYITEKYSPTGQRVWQRIYNGSPATSSTDTPVAMALDGSGNVVVTGTSFISPPPTSSGSREDFATVKYSPSGQLLWTARYNGGNYQDIAADVAIDGLGNVYVTGTTRLTFNSQNSEAVTVKYSVNGTQQWTTTTTNSSGLTTARNVAVSGASASVFVTSGGALRKYSSETGQQLWAIFGAFTSIFIGADVFTTGTSNNDYVTARYSEATGQQLWQATYDGPGNAVDGAANLVMDDYGDVFVTGSSGNDFATLKYNKTTGQQLWEARYNSPIGGNDVAYELVPDRAGNTYVTGSSVTANGDRDFNTVKYSPIGEQLWQIQYSGPNNTNDVATEIALDANDNVYVGGGRTIVKYEQSTIQDTWAARFNGAANSDDLAVDVAIDRVGNAYVAGYSYNGSSWDYVTAKYSAIGTPLWAVTYNGAASSDDLPSSIAVERDGTVYVTGTSYSSARGRYDYVTLKYSTTGQLLWEAHSFASASSDDLATDVVIGPDGNPVVTGTSYSGSQSDYVTRKYAAATGTQVWAATYNGPANSYDLVKDLGVDNQGNVAVTGTSDAGATSGYDYATVKYNGINGQQQWVARHAGAGSSYDEATALTTDGPGYVTVTGYADNGSGYDYTTLQYTAANGLLSWTARYNGPANSYDEASDIAADLGGNIVVTGRSYNSSGNSDYATVKYVRVTGQQLWATVYNGSATGNDEATAVAIDYANNVYVTGYSTTPDGTDGYATVRYSGSGQQEWEERYNGPGNSYDEPAALVVDGTGNAYVTGFSVGAGTGYDFATLKYPQSGAMAALVAASPSDAASVLAVTPASKSEQDLSVYPNPAVGETSVSFRPASDGVAQVLVYNQQGRQVASLYTGAVHKGQRYTLALDGQKLAPGLYTCSLLVDGKRETVRLVIGH
ncbi:SBBP repeat-containing protein [Hymenobacter tibetensis]|uniref:SBBP repeat-containing protein n=1 Tax=Hymenobacter tibetensis TaxID=497967 RepID=A0ABY4CST4_9BACT|nr:SBBP repeat-containing protein [Hymenobacter tibetensis]UOG73186.1 SBBP repeat-containing protein [Hymenobacter tibetensis]